MAGDLIEAIKAQNEERVRALLEERPDLAEARDDAGVSALMLTHYYGIEGAAVRAARRSPLDVFEAATVGDLDRLRALLDEEPELARARSSDDTTALHFAAFFSQPEAARLLLERGADPHAVSPTFGNVTPLHSAAAARNGDTVRALLDAGADANARQGGGFTAIHAAAQNGDPEMLDDLLAHGADPTLATDEGRTAADFAAEQGHEQLAARLRSG
jgi:ankyrin repeat protein